MAIVDRNTIKDWFKTAKKPTQEQFWNWIDSFRHISEKLSITDVTNLQEQLNGKATSNHSHDDLAKIDASNITVADWLTALGLNSIVNPSESNVLLTQDYPTYELEAGHNQRDLNLKVLAFLNNLYDIKLSYPTSSGNFELVIDENGDATWIEKSVQVSEEYTITETDISSPIITIPLAGNVDENYQTLLYIRGLFVGKDSYIINTNNEVEITRASIVYPIDAGDLIDIIYYKLH